MLGLWITLGVIGFLVIVAILYVVGTRNSLVKMRNNVEESFSAMDISMKKRYDLVPNLVNTIKGATSHENKTLVEVVNARNACLAASTKEEKSKAEAELSHTLKNLFALTESYPDLKANTNFLDLQAKLETLELEIANSRRYYNANVKELNNKVEMFPSNVVAKWFKFEKEKMFELDNVEERKNVKVEF
ncbi:MAG: LemA family protein [Clostridia bacterium]|nr:LemA family protein [Clostridia bacterium]